MMWSANRHPFRPRLARPAFTLLELLLVLAVLVAVAAVAAPAIFGPLENYRLRKAGELVRARWAKARSEAMRTGRTLMFRFQPVSNQFEVAPWYSDTDYVESSMVLSGAVGTGSMAQAQASGTSAPRVEQLPGDIQFVALQGVLSSRDAAVQQTMQMTQSASQALSEPILFYPDGTTSTAQVVLGNNRQQFIIVKLRGLSGIAEVTDLLSAVELAQ